jgi:formylglycine-generating enzyme
MKLFSPAFGAFLCLGVCPVHAAQLAIQTQPIPQLLLTGKANTVQSVIWTDSFAPDSTWQVLTNIPMESTARVAIGVDSITHSNRFYQAFEVPSGFVWLPPASFLVGSPLTEAEREPGNAEIQHTVTLTKGCWMARFEVTQALYSEIAGENPSTFLGPSNPVDSVSWHQSTNFCGQLTQREQSLGHLPSRCRYRLPTEAEWEYACRAGTTTAFYFGDVLRYGMARFNSQIEYSAARGSYSVATNPIVLGSVQVGSFAPNAFGIYDMHGNVSEWCADGFGDYPTGPVVDPKGLAPDVGRVVVRGGAWAVEGRVCRSSIRYGGVPEHRHYGIGFRMVLEVH